MARANQLRWPSANLCRVPYAVFLDPQIYEQEQAQLFNGPVWLFLGLEAEIPDPGDYKTTYAGDAPVVIDRAEDGSLHAFVNSCAHRGTLVVRDRRGNAANHTCVYHHWCYDLRGDLIGVPFERGIAGVGGMPEDFDRSAHGLQRLRVASYRGVIFGTFDADAEPLEDFLDVPIREFLDRLFAKPIVLLGHRRQRFPCNWKLYYENYGDGYHAGLLHQLAAAFGLHRATQTGARTPDKFGRHAASYVLADSDDRDVVEQGYQGTRLSQQIGNPLQLEDLSFAGWRDEVGDGHVVRTCSVFPSALFAQVGNVLETEQIRPKSATEFELYWTYFGYADDDDELRRKRFEQANMVGPAGYNNMEDGEVGILAQRGIRRRGDDHSFIEMGGRGPVEYHDGHHRVSETMVRGFWQHYCRLLGVAPTD
jgi:anthranilate 1,2-dioxygenase large subunit